MNNHNLTIPVSPSKNRPIRSFVLRQGRITTAQTNACTQLWPRYGYDVKDNEPLDPHSLFTLQQPLRLEIGFGNGEALLHMATACPDYNFLGIEVHGPGVGHLLLELERTGIQNVKILRHDAVAVIRTLPLACLERIYIFFPDPWPKLRHHKRRLIQQEFIAELVRILQPGGFLHIATDWEEYARWILAILNNSPLLINQSDTGDFIPRPEYRPLTRFESRGQRLGHKVQDILFCFQPDSKERS